MIQLPWRLSDTRRGRGFIVLLVAAALLALAGAATAEMTGNTKVTWYGQAAFKIETPSGGVILIDPWLKNPKNPDKNAMDKLTKVDYILLTHAHGDHVGNSIAIAKKFGAKLVTAAGLRRNMVAVLGYPKDHAKSATSGNVGGLIKLPDAGAQVTIVNAVHGSEITRPSAQAGGPAAVVGGNPIGFVLEVQGGPTFYHTGDTDVFTDMKLIPEFFKVDVMLATIGDHFTMGPRRAALAVEFVTPKVVVPMHFGTFGLLTGRPAELQQELAKRNVKVEMIEMKPGETRMF